MAVKVDAKLEVAIPISFACNVLPTEQQEPLLKLDSARFFNYIGAIRGYIRIRFFSLYFL
jgi:hypothetical protein